VLYFFDKNRGVTFLQTTSLYGIMFSLILTLGAILELLGGNLDTIPFIFAIIFIVVFFYCMVYVAPAMLAQLDGRSVLGAFGILLLANISSVIAFGLLGVLLGGLWRWFGLPMSS
jgi:hypothetical protein